ncbi:ScbR family autoregulator-binding transcription factor [Pseudonocardia saturnea]
MTRHNGNPARRQPRAVATRRALLRAGGAQFAATGFHKASLGEIVERAGVTKGALYFHFTGKQALADAVIAEMVATWDRLLARVETLGLDPLATLVAGTEQAASLMVDDPVVAGGARLLNDPLVSSEWAGEHYGCAETAVRTQLTAAAAAGLLRPEVDLTVLARSVITLVAGHNLICERTDTLDELTGHIADMWRAVLPLIATDAWMHARRDSDHRPA